MDRIAGDSSPPLFLHVLTQLPALYVSVKRHELSSYIGSRSLLWGSNASRLLSAGYINKALAATKVRNQQTSKTCMSALDQG